MNKRVVKKIVGIVLAVSVMFSDFSAFYSDAFTADSVLIDDAANNNAVMEEEKDISVIDTPEGELGREAAEEEEKSDEIPEIEADGEVEGESDKESPNSPDEKSEDKAEEETAEKQEEEPGEEAERETDGESEEKADDEGDVEISVSGNEIHADELELYVSEDEGLMPEAEIAEGEVVGDTIPLKSYMLVAASGEASKDEYGSSYIPDAEPEKLLPADEVGKDWAYALCSSLEASFKKKYPKEQISIDQNVLVDYLYSENKDSANDKYGSISKDFVNDPKNGKGNIHTAMWTVATGYAVVTKQNKRYRLNNIYMYHGTEIDKIKKAIMTQGEVATSLYRNENCFQENENYKSKYKLSYHCPYSMQPGKDSTKEHAVTVVGWDDDYSYTYFPNQEEDWKNSSLNGAWLVKDNCGYNGIYYYWVSYYDNAYRDKIGEEGNKNFYAFDFTKDSENAHTYQYDGGSSCYMPEVFFCEKAVNIFPKAGIHEALSAVSFGTYTQNARYAIQVYLEARPADGENDEPSLKKPLFNDAVTTAEYPQWGYYTVDLEQYADQYICDPYISSLDEESYFAVEITIEPGDNFNSNKYKWKTFWIDGPNGDGVEPVCDPDDSAVGQSYFYKDGEYTDFGKYTSQYKDGKGSNIRIKAHTQDMLAIESSGGNAVWMGETLNLQAAVGKNKIDAWSIQWSCDNEEIAAVSQSGIVYPKSPGYARITADSEEYGSDTIEIMVKDVRFSNSPLLLCSNSINKENRTGQIECSFYPLDYQPQKIDYRINDEDNEYLQIDSQGRVTARDGKMKDNIPIWVTISDEAGTITREASVSCYLAPTKFKIVTQNQEEKETYEIKVSEQLQFQITDLEPEGAKASDIVWRTSNAAVASVTPKGKVYAFKKGTATIKAFSRNNPSVEKSVKITVKEGISGLSFSENYISIAPNESKKLELKFSPKNIDNPDIEWSLKDMEGREVDLSSNTAISFNPDTMMISAGSEDDIKAARFRLYARCGSVVDSCYIKINVPVKNISLSFIPDGIEKDIQIQTSVYINRTAPLKLYAGFEPEGLSTDDVRLFYSSDNPDVAKVTRTGEVIPLKTGSADLTVKTENGISDTVHLTVQSIYTEINLEAYNNKIYAGGSGYMEPASTLAYVTADSNAAVHAEDFDWTSSDKNVATVSADGRIEAVSKGNATITAADKLNPLNRAGINIEVGIGVREIQIERDYIEIAADCKAAVNYKVLPSDADGQVVTLSTENWDIISCTNNEITALKEGEARVYLETVNGIRKEIDVCVKKERAEYLKLELKRDGTEVDYVTTRGTKDSGAQIIAKALSKNGSATDVSQCFTYDSDNPDILQVDGNGYVTGINAGTAAINVCAADGSGAREVLNVTVRNAKSGIKSVVLNHSSVELEKGEELQLIAAVFTDNAFGTNEVNWRSADESVAIVDSVGLVSVKEYGRTYIIAESLDGKKSAKCEIKVLPLNSNIKLLKINNQILESRNVNPDSAYQASIYASDGEDYCSYCEFTSSNTNVCTVDEKGLIIPTEQADTGTSVITANVKDDPLHRKVSFKIKLTNKKQVSDIRLYAELSSGESEISEEAAMYLPSEFGKTISLWGTALERGGNFAEDCQFKWSVSDKKVVSVKDLKNGKANLIIKGNGSCVLTCSIRNNPQVSVDVPVYVYDKKPVLTEKKLSINLLKNETVLLPLQKCAGTRMEELELVYVKKGKTYLDEGFDVVYNDEFGQYALDYNAKHIGKGNYTVCTRALMSYDNTKEGKILKEIYHDQTEYSEILEFSVNITEKKPKTKVKKPVLNVFEKNASTELEIASDAEINNILLSDSKKSQITRKFRISKKDGKFWINAGTDEKGTFNAVLQVYFKDYVNPVPIKCTIKTVVNKPKLIIVQNSLFAYKSSKENSNESADISFNIWDTAENDFISQNKGYKISKGGTLKGDKAVVSGLNAYGKKNIELSIINTSRWNGGITLKVPVTIENESKIAVLTSQSKVNLNKKVKNDCAQVSVYMKQQNIQAEIKEVNIYDSDNNLSDGILKKIIEKDNIVEFELQEHCDKGKYRAEIKVEANGNEYEKHVVINVKDVQPNVKVKLKGSIDLYDRTGTYMTGTVAISNAAGKVVNVTSGREDFEVVYDVKTQQFTLALKQSSMISKKKQAVILNIHLSSGAVLGKSVNINLSQSKVRWRKQKNVVLYKSMGNRSVIIPFEAESPSGITSQITVLSLPKGIKSYSPENGQILLYIDNDNIKAGKYKVRTAVQIFDAKGITPMCSNIVKQDIVIQVR